MNDKHHINLLLYKEVLKLCKKKEKYKNSLFKKKFNIEGYFGNIKNKYVNGVKFEVAKTVVYIKFLAHLMVIFLYFTMYYCFQKILALFFLLSLSNRLRDFLSFFSKIFIFFIFI